MKKFRQLNIPFNVIHDAIRSNKSIHGAADALNVNYPHLKNAQPLLVYIGSIRIDESSKEGLTFKFLKDQSPTQLLDKMGGAYTSTLRLPAAHPWNYSLRTIHEALIAIKQPSFALASLGLSYRNTMRYLETQYSITGKQLKELTSLLVKTEIDIEKIPKEGYRPHLRELEHYRHGTVCKAQETPSQNSSCFNKDTGLHNIPIHPQTSPSYVCGALFSGRGKTKLYPNSVA